MIGGMTETPTNAPSSTEPQTEPVHTTTPPPYVETRQERRRPNRVTTFAAWVGIAAGVVFVVAVVFFSGFILGRSSDGGHHRGGGAGHGQMMFHRDGLSPMMGSRGQFEHPGMPFAPGQPGMQTPQQTQPGNPTTTAPARP